MTKLTKKINELSKKRTWIRDSYEKFMEEWEEKTKAKDVKIYATVLIVEDYGSSYEYHYKLVTGKKEVHYVNVYGDLMEYSENKWSWESLPIKDIKKIISNLPKAIKEIEDAIDKKIQEENNIIFPKY